MTIPASVSLALSFPLLPGAANPLPGIGVNVPLTYTAQLSGEAIPLTGAETYNIDLAMMPATGLQGLMVNVDRVDSIGGLVTTPVKIVFTGGLLWLPPGGGFALGAPAIAANGITSLQIVTTASAVVHVSALG